MCSISARLSDFSFLIVCLQTRMNDFLAAGKMMIIGKRMNLTPDLLLLFLGLCLSRSCNDPALGTTQGLIASGDHHREAKERCCHQGERKRPRHVQDQRLQREK